MMIDFVVREFNGLIRADNFTKKDFKTDHEPIKSILYLLSHSHSDHTIGLNTFNDQDCYIYCSSITKDLILNLKTLKQRINSIKKDDEEEEGEDEYKFENLRSNSILKALPMKKPIEIILRPTLNPNQNQTCQLTLFDANHSPGSVMFLIQMWNKSILYTGDIRAEPWWIESLTKESILAPFLDFNHFNHLKDHHHHPRIRLDNIYLDTSALLYKKSVLTKEQAILSTLRFMSLYPSHTIFFINTWTWGWEELLERISLHFQTLIHVDQYKFDLYTLPSLKKHYPLLSTSITLDSKLTRFHACERKQRCDECQDERYQILSTEQIEIQSKEKESFKRRVVMVNPMEINDQRWFRIEVQLQYEIDLALDQEKINSSENDLWPSLIVSPFTRHSSFQELHKLISIFKPKSLFPNTTQAKQGFIEYFILPILFKSVLSDGAIERLEKEAKRYVEEYSGQVGELRMEECVELMEDLMRSLPNTFSEFDHNLNPFLIESELMNQTLKEIDLEEIVEGFEGFDEEDEVIEERFVDKEEGDGKKRVGLDLNSIESEVGWVERDLIEEEDEVIESLNEFTAREFVSNQMNEIPKDDDCVSLRNQTNQIDQIDEERSDREKAQEIKSNQIQICDSSLKDEAKEKKKELGSIEKSINLRSSSENDGNLEKIETHRFYTTDWINQRLSKLSKEVRSLNQRWLKTLNELQIDLRKQEEEEEEEEEEMKEIFEDVRFQLKLIDLILISQELNQLKLLIIDSIHQLYSKS
ncbi:hypothetical protein DFH28DRAFT_20588 [Melampsora americana]|nr:hypothetical protein DFH28DRAFT_20588 [Melampsora americana]